jgi:UDP-GlcNAc:undecaprenyl-phosphate GlcNAc-1-phosphate transferase
VLCASVLLAAGVRIEGFMAYPLSPWVGGLLTVFWVVAIVNAINFIDGLDGLAAGVTAIATVSFAIICVMRGQVGAAVLAAALAAGCIGFLPYNFSPARVFMGDLGSHFLGYVVAAITIAGTLKKAAAVTLASATLVLAFPLLDTAFAVVRRFLRGQAISVGDNEHLHHRLVHGGLTDAQAVLLIWGICAAFSVVAVFISQRGGG